MSPVEAVAEGVVAILAVFLVFYLLYYGVVITLYILGSLGLYTIAKRREIKHPWMAWVPGLSYWTLGSVSDQYQYVAKGKVRNNRKWMAGFMIAMIVLMVAMYVVYFISYFKIIFELGLSSELEYMDDMQVAQKLLSSLGSTAIVALAYGVVSIVLAVFQYICYYHLFASCDPENKVLYLVLGILFSFLMPIFTFVCRKKDLGMPPRKDDPVAYIPQPVYEMPAQTAEPWNQTQEAQDEMGDGLNP